jgi:hypothetical protein
MFPLKVSLLYVNAYIRSLEYGQLNTAGRNEVKQGPPEQVTLFVPDIN